MEHFWFWIFVLLIVLAIFAWPTWPYTRERWIWARGGGWRYGPSMAALIVLFALMLLFVLELIAVAWPWYVTTPA